jgi:hypothetical protein
MTGEKCFIGVRDGRALKQAKTDNDRVGSKEMEVGV